MKNARFSHASSINVSERSQHRSVDLGCGLSASSRFLGMTDSPRGPDSGMMGNHVGELQFAPFRTAAFGPFVAMRCRFQEPCEVFDPCVRSGLIKLDGLSLHHTR